MTGSNIVNWLNPGAPKGLIQDTQDWIVRANSKAPQLRQPQPAAWSREVFAAEESINLLSYAFEPTPDEEFSSVRWTHSPAANLYYLQGCRVLGAEGAVISADNRVFAEFTLAPAQDWSEHACFKRRRIPDVTPLKGWYATIAWPESRFFFHWMIETLPRMAVLGKHAAMLDGLFVPSPLLDFHRESLHLLGIDESKLIPLDVQSHFAPQHLFVPRAFAMYNPARWMIDWFQESFVPPSGLAARPAATRKIYVSRADAPARRVANEEQVLRLTESLGFETVRLSEHTFQDQARIFNEADVVVGANGAGFSNLVFCRPDTRVIEVMSPGWMAPCFMVLATRAGLRYRHLMGVPLQDGKPDPQRDDIQIPVDELASVLRDALN